MAEVEEALKEMRRVIREDLPAAVACGDPIGCEDCARKWEKCLQVIEWQRNLWKNPKELLPKSYDRELTRKMKGLNDG